MIAEPIRNEPYPYEEFLIEDTLESAPEQLDILGAIQQLVDEQHDLRMQLVRHPLRDQAARARMSAIESQLQALWQEVRRVRAVRRVELEEALGINAAAVVN